METVKTNSMSVQQIDQEIKLDLKNLPKLPLTLEALQYLRTAKGQSDSHIHPYLDKAYKECAKADIVLLLERIMLHIGDVSRAHNILREMNIKSPSGGAQERGIFRSCMRWWEKNIPNSFERNMRVFVEFTNYENLMFYTNKTDRLTGKPINTEILFPMPEVVWRFLTTQVRAGKDLNLIARHLPKLYSDNSTSRTTKKTIKYKKGQKEFNYRLPKKAWVKLNGELITGETVSLKPGDVISYPRKKQDVSLKRQKFINDWIKGFCRTIGWDLNDYRKFRSTQNTPEQSFSSKSVLNISEAGFKEMLNRLTSGQRFRVAKMVAYKDGNNLHPHAKWGDLGKWYIEWEKNQEKVADALREVAASGGDDIKKQELMSQFKVKATGLQTVDILAEIFKGQLNNTQINNTYQSLIEKMDLIANVFPILDGSGSMDTHKVKIGNVTLTTRQIAYSMCIAFSTRNPVDKFRNTYGWFSRNFHICGRSEFVNLRPNPYVDSKPFTKKVSNHQVLSAEKTFTENLNALYADDQQEVCSTNMFSSVEFFVNLVKDGSFTVEDLPKALLFITDCENNTGRTPKEGMAHANSIGWHPLVIFWGLTAQSDSTKRMLNGIPNTLFVGGFNESCLSQILRGIKTGSISPETELWSIYNDKRYSVLS